MRDLTLVAVMIGVMTCPSPTGEGMGLTSFLCDGGVQFPINALIETKKTYHSQLPVL